MAVHTYGATNISFSSFDEWSNQFSSDSDVSLNTLMDNLEPGDTAPHSVSELRNNSFLYGDVSVSGAPGTVRVSSGYTGQNATSSSFALKNVNFDDVSSVTITAQCAYPNYLEGFYSGPNGTGDLLRDYSEPATTGDLSLTSTTFQEVDHIYAYFVNAHA